MGRRTRVLVAVAGVVVLSGCATPPVEVGTPPPTVATATSTPSSTAEPPSPAAPPTTSPSTSPTTSPTTTPSATPQPTTRPTAKPAACTVSSRTWKGHRRFYTSDRTCYTSPWFAGTHRIMIGFGCNPSPWYPRARVCHWKGGVHHGIDVDMPIGTAVRSAVAGTALVRPSTMGSAYGRNGLIIRARGRDYVLGHLSRLKVRNGQHVSAGQLIARSGMSGVENEDGPHLHFEVRPAGRGYRSAVQPRSALRLTART